MDCRSKRDKKMKRIKLNTLCMQCTALCMRVHPILCVLGGVHQCNALTSKSWCVDVVVRRYGACCKHAK